MFSSTTHGIEAQSDAACVERAMKRKRDVATSQQMTARATERKREREASCDIDLDNNQIEIRDGILSKHRFLVVYCPTKSNQVKYQSIFTLKNSLLNLCIVDLTRPTL